MSISNSNQYVYYLSHKVLVNMLEFLICSVFTLFDGNSDVRYSVFLIFNISSKYHSLTVADVELQ
jgi:hypothetical protein